MMGVAGCSGADSPGIPDYVPEVQDPVVSITVPSSSARTASAAPTTTPTEPKDAGPDVDPKPVPHPLPILGPHKQD